MGGAGRGGEREKGEAPITRQARKVDRGRVHAAAKVPTRASFYIYTVPGENAETPLKNLCAL